MSSNYDKTISVSREEEGSYHRRDVTPSKPHFEAYTSDDDNFEEWTTSKRKVNHKTRQVETRVSRQLLVEDGKVIADSGPQVTTRIKEDNKVEECEKEKAPKNKGKFEAIDMAKEVGESVDGRVLREKKEVQRVSREVREENMQYHDERFKELTGHDVHRRAIQAPHELITITDKQSHAAPRGKMVHYSNKGKKYQDTDEILEVAKLALDGSITKEVKRTKHHEEFSEDEKPDEKGEAEALKKAPVATRSSRRHVDYVNDFDDTSTPSISSDDEVVEESIPHRHSPRSSSKALQRHQSTGGSSSNKKNYYFDESQRGNNNTASSSRHREHRLQVVPVDHHHREREREREHHHHHSRQQRQQRHRSPSVHSASSSASSASSLNVHSKERTASMRRHEVSRGKSSSDGFKSPSQKANVRTITPSSTGSQQQIYSVSKKSHHRRGSPQHHHHEDREHDIGSPTPSQGQRSVKTTTTTVSAGLADRPHSRSERSRGGDRRPSPQPATTRSVASGTMSSPPKTSRATGGKDSNNGAKRAHHHHLDAQHHYNPHHPNHHYEHQQSSALISRSSTNRNSQQQRQQRQHHHERRKQAAFDRVGHQESTGTQTSPIDCEYEHQISRINNNNNSSDEGRTLKNGSLCSFDSVSLSSLGPNATTIKVPYKRVMEHEVVPQQQEMFKANSVASTPIQRRDSIGSEMRLKEDIASLRKRLDNIKTLTVTRTSDINGRNHNVNNHEGDGDGTSDISNKENSVNNQKKKQEHFDYKTIVAQVQLAPLAPKQHVVDAYNVRVIEHNSPFHNQQPIRSVSELSSRIARLELLSASSASCGGGAGHAKASAKGRNQSATATSTAVSNEPANSNNVTLDNNNEADFNLSDYVKHKAVPVIIGPTGKVERINSDEADRLSLVSSCSLRSSRTYDIRAPGAEDHRLELTQGDGEYSNELTKLEQRNDKEKNSKSNSDSYNYDEEDNDEQHANSKFGDERNKKVERIFDENGDDKKPAAWVFDLKDGSSTAIVAPPRPKEPESPKISSKTEDLAESRGGRSYYLELIETDRKNRNVAIADERLRQRSSSIDSLYSRWSDHGALTRAPNNIIASTSYNRLKSFQRHLGPSKEPASVEFSRNSRSRQIMPALILDGTTTRSTTAMATATTTINQVNSKINNSITNKTTTGQQQQRRQLPFRGPLLSNRSNSSSCLIGSGVARPSKYSIYGGLRQPDQDNKPVPRLSYSRAIGPKSQRQIDSQSKTPSRYLKMK